MQAVTRLGLTGGIGSGKSTVAHLLAACGAAVIDADAISRQVTAVGGPAIAPIRQAFGAEFITDDGALDRVRMRECAFRDPGARHRLEQIIHPLVGLESQRQLGAALHAGHRCVVFDVPLLVESGRWRAKLDTVLVVDCSAETQIERVMARDGLARESVQAILANQASRARRLQAADHVICNDGVTLLDLEGLVRSLGSRLGL